MKLFSNNFFRIIFIFLVYTQNFSIYAQLSINDSLVIKSNHAINIMDSIHSSLSNNLRIITINYFIKKGLDPNKYYSIDNFKFQEINVKNRENVFYLELMKIGALREIGQSSFHTGGYGTKDDDIYIIFDKELKKILGVSYPE